MGGQGIDQLRHHLHIHHRGFIDHDQIRWQRVGGVVAKVPAVGQAAQQAVQGADTARDAVFQLLVKL